MPQTECEPISRQEILPGKKGTPKTNNTTETRPEEPLVLPPATG